MFNNKFFITVLKYLVLLKWLDLVDERNHSLLYKSLLPQQGHINVNPVFPAFHLLFSFVGGKLMIGCIVEKWWLEISWSVRQNFYYDFFKLYVILRARLGHISVTERFKNKTKAFNNTLTAWNKMFHMNNDPEYVNMRLQHSHSQPI